MSHPLEESAELPQTTSERPAGYADAVSHRNGLTVVTLVLGSVVLITGRSLLADINDVARWVAVFAMAGAFVILVYACLYAANAVGNNHKADQAASGTAAIGLAVLGVAFMVAWLAPSAERSSLPDGNMWVDYHVGDLRGSAKCATVTQQGTMFRVADQDGRIILLPQSAILDMTQSKFCK